MSKLIVIEGTDASGKGTQCKIIQKYLQDKGLTYNYFHFPMYGHNQFSDIIARFLRGEFGSVDQVDPYFVANIYAMDRFMFLPELIKSLETHDVVLLDRYVYSNISYQAAKFLDILESQKMISWIMRFEFGFLNLPYPDINIFLDLPIEITGKRLEDKREGNDRDYLKGKSDIHETDLGFQERVRQNYLNTMEGGRNCKIIKSYINTNEGFSVLSPEDLFNSYKKDIDYVLSH